jgi:hypothetical protein
LSAHKLRMLIASMNLPNGVRLSSLTMFLSGWLEKLL